MQNYSIAPRTPPGQGRGISKKVKSIEQLPFKLNGNYIQVVSRGACDRKGTLQGSILSLRWVVKMVPKLFQDPPLTPPGGWKNEVVDKRRRLQKKQKTRYHVRAKLGLPSDPQGQRDGPKTARRRPREPLEHPSCRK